MGLRITPINGSVILKRLEECGRVCYKSEGKITDDSAPKFVAGIIKRGHEAVLEHCSFTVKFICDRGVSEQGRVQALRPMLQTATSERPATSGTAHPRYPMTKMPRCGN